MTPAAQREQPAVAATTAAEGTLKGYPALGTCWTLGKKRGPVGNLGVPAIPSFLHSFDKWAPRPWSVPTSAPGIGIHGQAAGKDLRPRGVRGPWEGGVQERGSER